MLNNKDSMDTNDDDINSLKLKLEDSNALIANYRKLIKINTIIASILDKEKVLHTITQQTKILLKCDKCSVLLIDQKTNKLQFNIVSNQEEMEGLVGITLEKGEGIAGTVWDTGKPYKSINPSQDPNFSNKVDKKMHIKTESLLEFHL